MSSRGAARVLAAAALLAACPHVSCDDGESSPVAPTATAVPFAIDASRYPLRLEQGRIDPIAYRPPVLYELDLRAATLRQVYAAPSMPGGYQYAPYPARISVSPDASTAALGIGDELVLVDIATGAEQRVRQPAPIDVIGEVTWEPSGERLAFNASGSLYVANADGSGAYLVGGAGPIGGEPEWSPGGPLIAAYNGYADIGIFFADGGGVRNLGRIDINRGDRDFSWSPDGMHLVFADRNPPSTTGLPGYTDLHIATFEGRDIRVIAASPETDESTMAWSPDGRAIAFTRDDIENSIIVRELWLVSPDGSNARKLADGGGLVLRWSPDASRIASVSADGVTVVDATTGSSVLVASSSPPCYAAVAGWSPDGARLYVTSECTPGGH